MKKFSLLFFILFLVSCSDRPSRAKFPGPPGRTSEFQQAQKTQEVLGGFDSFGRSLGEAPDKSISGIVDLGKNVKLPTKDFIVFISARPLAGGPPLAAKKMKVDKFPFRFLLGEADVVGMMAGGGRFEGFVELSIRVDQVEDGGGFDPLSRQSGDLFTSSRVKVGTADLRLSLDQVVE